MNNIIKDPSIIIRGLNKYGFLRWLPDEIYLKWRYKLEFGKKPDLEKPVSYNEKLQWLKLNDRNPLYTELVDKYEVRKYVAENIGEEYLVPLIGVWDSVEEIKWSELPNQFVLKCTHDSGGLIICKDKSKLDIDKAKSKLQKSLKTNYYYAGREWPYKNVQPRIIAEKYLVDESNVELKDYKYLSFNGEPKVMFIASNRSTDTKFDYYDLNFNHLKLKQYYDNSNMKLDKPKNFDKMTELAKKLSSDFPHVRVDFYNISGKIFFGELTFYHFGGFKKIEPNSYDELWGSWLKLPQK